jgi:uncharacterized membrane protein
MPDAESVESPGPIQLLTVAFPGNKFRGEILPELDRLKRKRIVRVIDMMIVRKDKDGHVMTARASDLDWDEAVALGSYFGSLAGFASGGADGFERGAIAGAAELADGHIFDEDDVFRVTQALTEDTTAAVVLVEHLWARPLLDAVDRAGGVELLNEWVRPSGVLRIELPSSGTGLSGPEEELPAPEEEPPPPDEE